ncbi:hypothetical protein BgiBS90_000451 [Biomphalaria glabrata]|nr:hypothetical protein BgiBS90_000451 [Biomphalaria glabrata]
MADVSTDFRSVETFKYGGCVYRLQECGDVQVWRMCLQNSEVRRRSSMADVSTEFRSEETLKYGGCVYRIQE